MKKIIRQLFFWTHLDRNPLPKWCLYHQDHAAKTGSKTPMTEQQLMEWILSGNHKKTSYDLQRL